MNDKEKCYFCEKRNATHQISPEITVCYVCQQSSEKDVNLLKNQPCEISIKQLLEWLKKYGETNHALFINGCFNKKPEALLHSESKLNNIPLKSLWVKFK